jgi:Na+/proline symporter
MFGINPIDALIVIAYLVVVIWLGKRAASATKDQEGFFLAGRKMGKLYQFFMNFGNSTEPQGAVTTASLVYANGASKSWLTFQTIFISPFYWFVYVWFRRVRLTTVADLFEDRFNSKWLARFYACYQIGVAILLIAVGNFTAYTTTASLVLKPEITWTPAEHASVEGYNRLLVLEKQAAAAPLSAADQAELVTLRDLNDTRQLHRFISVLNPVWAQWTFYFIFTTVVGAYMVLGGMKGAALNNALQGLLVVVFSVLLVPVGLHAIGGWHALAQKVPHDKFQLLGASASGQYGFWYVVAFTWASLVQILGLSANMGILGSAKDEYAARFGGASGSYAKRFLIILWAFTGLIGAALFMGPNTLSEPDMLWGAMSNQLIGPDHAFPGLIGLMLAGVLAGTMSILAAKAVAISSLFVRNIYRHIWPDVPEAQAVRAARWAIVGVLILGLGAARFLDTLEEGVKLIIDVNIPFGAAIMLIYTWRRLTTGAIWSAVILSVLINIIVPNIFSRIHDFATTPALMQKDAAGHGVYFDAIVHTDPNNLASPLIGTGRFNFECYLLSYVGLHPENLNATGRDTARYFFDGIFPFVILILVSYITPQTNRARVDLFYGKMKTPVLGDPAADAATMEETRRNPRRHDHTKLFPNSSWEFGKWNRVDTIGFLACLATSGAIIGLFVGLLYIASLG